MQSIFISRMLAFLLGAGFFAQTALGQECGISSPDGLPGSQLCTITIERTAPASPPTITVRAGTTVRLIVAHARENEVVSFTPTTSKVAPVDIAGTFLKSAITPAGSINLIIHTTQDRIGALAKGAFSQPTTPIEDRFNDILKKLDATLSDIANAQVDLACLEAYRTVDGLTNKRTCTAAPLTDFATARDTTKKRLTDAAKEELPIADYKQLHDQVNPDKPPAGFVGNNAYMTLDALVGTVIGDTEKIQAQLLETADQIASIPNNPVTDTYDITKGKNYTSTITIAAQEVISKTTTTLATVTINWQANQWEISTGIMFSALKNQSFANAPLVVNGAPVPSTSDPTKNETFVQNTFTRPAVVVPMVMLNYRVRGLSDAGWENKCPGHCAVLLSGGVGLNVTQKDAEFGLGPSFQVGSVLFTVGAHIGRYTDLANGIGVGDHLGALAPGTLATTGRWTAKWGFGISYVLPWQ